MLEIRTADLVLISTHPIDQGQRFRIGATAVSWSADDTRIAVSCRRNCNAIKATVVMPETGAVQTLPLSSLFLLGNDRAVANGVGGLGLFDLSHGTPRRIGSIIASTLIDSDASRDVFMAIDLPPFGALYWSPQAIVGNSVGLHRGLSIGGVHEPDLGQYDMVPSQLAERIIEANAVEWFFFGTSPDSAAVAE